MTVCIFKGDEIFTKKNPFSFVHLAEQRKPDHFRFKINLFSYYIHFSLVACSVYNIGC